MNILVRFPGFKFKALTLSYDDGVRQDKKLIKIMQKHGLKGTFNLNTDIFGEETYQEEKGRMSMREAIELYTDSGMEIAVHGCKHLSLNKVRPELAVADVLNNRIALEKIFSRNVMGMAYANGAYDDAVVEILKTCGIKYARTITSTGHFEMPTDWLRLPATCHHNDKALMDLAKVFVEYKGTNHFWANTVKMFYLWGHSYEFDTNNNWDVIEKFAEYIGGHDDIWYATNGEIYDYVKASEQLEFSADGNYVYNPTNTTIYLINFANENKIVKPGERICLV